jgi:hypothetical protein
MCVGCQAKILITRKLLQGLQSLMNCFEFLWIGANCLGIVYGTVFPLAFKPRVYNEDYWYCKGGYALHCLLFCDDEMRIFDYLVGHPGSIHDNHVWMKTESTYTLI